jgi:hypothetical protein
MRGFGGVLAVELAGGHEAAAADAVATATDSD